VIVPRKTVAELAPAARGTARMAVEIGGFPIPRWQFTFGGVELTSKLIDGSFPDYQARHPDRETTRS